jgi:zinc protease
MNHWRQKLQAFALLSILATASPVLYAQSNHGEEIPVDSQVKIGKLKNGLTYYIRKNGEPQKRCELYLVVKAGSNMEDDDQRGLAHFAEHMAFNGTRDFPKNQLVDYLQKCGVRFGADLNAYTSFNETVYQLPIPTDDPAILAKGINILSNWAGHVTFEDEEIDKERGIIVEEDRQRGKDAGERMRNQILPVLLHDSRYADRLPIGKMETVQSFKPVVIKRYYKDWYRPNLQAVIVVGDLDIEAVEKMIVKNFSRLTNPKKERAREEYNIPFNDRPLVKVVTDPEFSYNVGYIMFKEKQEKSNTTDDLLRDGAYQMINSMFAARIQEIMEKGNAPFVHASGEYGAYFGGLGNVDAFSVSTVAKTPEMFKDAVQGIMSEVVRMRKFGFSESELNRAKENFRANIEKQFLERDKTSSSHYVNAYVGHFLKGDPIPGIEYLNKFYKENLSELNLSIINKMAGNLADDENCVAILEGLESNRAKLPDEATFLSWIRNAGINVTAYQDDILDKPLLDKTPAPGKIVSEKKFDTLAFTELRLSNGITVVLKPTDFKSDEVLFSSSSPGGTSLAADDEYFSASLAAEVITSSGVGGYDKSKLKKLLAGKVVEVNPYIDQHFEGIWGTSTVKDLLTAFQLIHLYFTQPRADSNVFRMIRDNYKVNVSARASFPRAVFEDTVSAVMGGYHKRSTAPTIEEVDKLNFDTAVRFYKERFADADDFTFFFVGNFQLEAIKPLLETYLGSLPGTERRETFVDLKIKPAPGSVDKFVRRGIEDKASVSLFLHDDYEFSEENNLMLDVLNSALKIKLVERLREKESGVYSPRVSVSYGKTPSGTFTFHINFSCASANVERLIQAALDEIRLTKENGVSSIDIAKFKAEEKSQQQLRIRDNYFWLNYLSATYTEAQEVDRVNRYLESLERITPETTKAAAKRFLNEENYKRIVLLPEISKVAP